MRDFSKTERGNAYWAPNKIWPLWKPEMPEFGPEI